MRNLIACTLISILSFEFFGAVLLSPQEASAQAATVIFLTSGTEWEVPEDWNDTDNSIEVIGGGGGGGAGTLGGGGGGGGAYSIVTNLDLTGGAMITYGIGAGGATEVAGGGTWFGAADYASCASATLCVKAAGGEAGNNGFSGAGGSTGVGTVSAGGDGGAGSSVGDHSSGGGGGAGGPNGVGGAGGAGDPSATFAEGSGGGGGASGGDDGVGSTASGGAGGANFANRTGSPGGGGAGGSSSNGSPGSDGSGGGGASHDFSGGAGGDGVEWDATHGAGGGGGGGSDSSDTGGDGGLYGGGGGGVDSVSGGGTGGDGIIVITYQPGGGGGGASAALTRPPNNLGLVGYWSFDDGTGTVATDFSGNGNHGTLSGDVSWAPGRFGGALDFAGLDDYVTMPTFDETLLPATFSAWVKIPSESQNECVGFMFSRGTDTSGINLGSCGDQTRVGYHWNDDIDSYDWTGGPVVPDDIWALVVLVVESTQATTYVYSADGQFSGVNTISHDATTIDALKIGIDDSDSEFRAIDALIDDVRIYNRALTETEVLQLYNRGAVRIGASSVDLQRGSSLASGLVGHWTFDGKDVNWSSATAGTALDRSGEGNTATLASMDRNRSVDGGVLGQALQLDGLDDSITVTDDSSLAITDFITLSAWMNTSSSTATQGLISRWGDTNSYALALNYAEDPDTINFFLAGLSSPFAGVESAGVTDGQWHLITGTYDGATMRVYVDGEEADSLSSTGTINDNDMNLRIGRDGTGFGAAYLNGGIDDVRIYNRALTPAEVKQLYQLGQVRIVQ